MIKFSRNMSTLDRSLRILLGIGMFLLGPLTDFVETDRMSNIILSVLGSTALLSGTCAYCFLYDITGFDSRKKSD